MLVGCFIYKEDDENVKCLPFRPESSSLYRNDFRGRLFTVLTLNMGLDGLEFRTKKVNPRDLWGTFKSHVIFTIYTRTIKTFTQVIYGTSLVKIPNQRRINLLKGLLLTQSVPFDVNLRVGFHTLVFR